MKKLFYLLPVAFVLLIACNNSTQKNEEYANQTKTEMNKAAVESNHQHEEAANKIILDSGKKWKANPETMTGIANMESIVQKGIAGKFALTALYAPLQLEFKTIF